MVNYAGINKSLFADVCDCNFGRTIIYTRAKKIDASNVLSELREALTTHSNNVGEITYLERYYRGDKPILYREKVTRPEINNKVVVNLSFPLVETKTSEMAGEPIQYVLRGADETKSEEVAKLNTILDNESKAESDIELCRWRSICGTSYRFIGNDAGKDEILDETDFYIDVCDPRETFVVYYSNNKQHPAFSVQIYRNEQNVEEYLVHTESEYFIINNNNTLGGDSIVERGINAERGIPVVEYPNNARRLSDIEITISIEDAINELASNRVDGIEQFVNSFIKFVNCEIDEDLFKRMRDEGALVVKSNNGSENKADVDLLTQELNQTEGQVVMDDLFAKFLIIQGLASRQSNTGGDTQGAVELRNGHYDSEKRAELSEPSFKKAERRFIKLLLNRMRVSAESREETFTLTPSDIEIKISRSKMDNMLVKAEVLQILLNSGIKYERAIKTVGLFSDPEQVSVESRKRMDILYPETEQKESVDENVNVTETKVEV